jgi:uncharacterized cupin superfamily protein
MSDDPNILEPEWDVHMPEAPFHARASRIAHRAGSERVGATLYELDPGGASAPYHLHYANEELLVVLGGEPELRTAEGARRLAAGAVVSFPAGVAGAHALRNPGPDPARYLIFSTAVYPDVAEYPDTGATLTVTGPGEGKAFPAGVDVPQFPLVASAVAGSWPD